MAYTWQSLYEQDLTKVPDSLNQCQKMPLLKKKKNREKEKTVAHDNDVLTTASFQLAKKQKYKQLCYDTSYWCNVIKLPSAKTNPPIKIKVVSIETELESIHLL